MLNFVSGKKFIKVMLVVSFSIFLGAYTIGTKQETRTAQLQERIGAPVVHSIEKASQISVSREGKSHVLTKEKVDALKAMLLDDKTYIFDRTKKCLFISAIAFRIEGKEEVQIVFSPSCNQIKFIANKQARILDYDPAADSLNALLKEILE